MKNVTKSTLRTVAEREASLSLDPWVKIDADEKTSVKIAKAPYGVDYRNVAWLIDENQDTATNTQTGEQCNIATFFDAYRKFTNKDNTFTSKPQLLDSNEIEDIVTQIQSSYYISEIVVTQSVSNSNDIVYTTSKVIIFKDEYEKAYMLRQELEKKTEAGADLLAFSEPRIYLSEGINNGMLYYTEDATAILSFLGFTDLINGTWYHRELGISATLGEYNFFKKAQKNARVNTQTAKALNTLASL